MGKLAVVWRLSAVAGLGLATVASACAAGKDVEDLLASMRHAYQSVKAATFTTKSTFGGRSFVNTVYFKNPNKVRFEVTSPLATDKGQMIVRFTDGETISTKQPKSQAYAHDRFTLLKLESGIPVNLESLCFFDWDIQLSTSRGKNMETSKLKIVRNEAWNGKKWLVLEETAEKQQVFCRYFIDPKSLLIWRTVVYPLGSKSVTEDCQISNLNSNALVPNSKFMATA